MPAAGAPGGGTGALYTGRGPVCGMIMRGGGAIGAAGLDGAGLCICATLPRAFWAGGCAVGGALPTGAAGVATRGGRAIAGGGALATGGAAGVVAAGGVAKTLGGITTTEGGRYVAATEAGVTILGAGEAGVGAGAFAAGLGGTAFGNTGAAGAFASPDGVVTGGLAAGRATGCSVASFCWVMARSTSPGREICERSILVLISSSP